MTVNWQASGTLLGSTGADITPVNPAHATNDILILQAAARSNAVTLATPAGWTLIAGPIDQGTTWRTYWFRLRAASAAEANPLCDWSAVTGDKYGVVHNLRGATTTGNPFAATATTAGTADPGSATGVTTNQPNQFVASIGMSGDNVANGFTSLTSTDPASYTVRSYTVITTGADAGRWLADATRTTAGATGNLSHDFNGAPLIWSILVAAVLTPLPVALTPAVVAFSAVTLDPDPGMVTTNLTPAVLSFAAVVVDPDPGMVTVALTPAVLTFSAVALDPEAAATVNLTPAVLSFSAVTLDPDPGMVTVNLTPASMTFSAIAVDPDPGMVSLTLIPAVLNLSAVTLDPDPGMVSINLNPGVLVFAAQPLDPQGAGSGTLNLSPATLNFAAQPLDPQGEGGVTVSVVINLNLPGFSPLVSGVGACIVEALDQTPAGAPTRQCLLLPSSMIPWDNCDCGGQVALSIRQTYGSDQFPTQVAPTKWAHCGPVWTVAEVLVSVTRCVTGLDQAGQPPPCATAFTEAMILENDRTAVRQAIACCLDLVQKASPPGLGIWALGPSVTLAEQGGCSGVETVFWVGKRDCACPNPVS